MFVKARRGRARGRVRFAAAGLYILLQIGCGGMSTGSTGLYREAPCAPSEVIGQLRESLTAQKIKTSEPTPEGRGVELSTDAIREQAGRRERSVKYSVLVQPVEGANKSTIILRRVEDKTKGIREKSWYDEEASAPDPQSEQQVWAQIQGVCRPAQPQ